MQLGWAPGDADCGEAAVVVPFDDQLLIVFFLPSFTYMRVLSSAQFDEKVDQNQISHIFTIFRLTWLADRLSKSIFLKGLSINLLYFGTVTICNRGRFMFSIEYILYF